MSDYLVIGIIVLIVVGFITAQFLFLRAIHIVTDSQNDAWERVTILAFEELHKDRDWWQSQLAEVLDRYQFPQVAQTHSAMNSIQEPSGVSYVDEPREIDLEQERGDASEARTS